MSKIGSKCIIIPNNVNVVFYSNINIFKVIGPYGSLSIKINNIINIRINNISVLVKPKIFDRKSKSLWGLTNSLISNMIKGVKKKFIKKLIIKGLGYNAKIKNNLLLLMLGYSHKILYYIPSVIKINCSRGTLIEVEGCDKYLVGQISSDIKNLRKPNPYKGKGIKYKNETLIKKEGKKK